MIELLRILFSTRGLQALGFFLAFSLVLALRYWLKYYEAFSLDILLFASPVDLLNLGLSRLMYAATVAMFGAVLLASGLLRMWVNKEGTSTTVDGFFLLLGLLSLALVPPFAIDRAAKNDARLVHGGPGGTLFATIKRSSVVTVEGSDGRRVEGYRWIGATSDYVFLLGPDSSRRIMSRAEAKVLDLR